MPAREDTARSLLGRLADLAAERLDARAAAELARRAERVLPTVLDCLRTLYGDAAEATAARLAHDLVDLAARRPEDLRELDRAREADPGWFQDPSMVGYVCYVDRFGATVQGVRGHLDHLDRLGVRYLHLMSVLAPRPGDSDGGYAVQDYDAVDPSLGTMADLTELARDLHRRGSALCVDLVLNHTAREHPWARAAMAGDPEYRDFYLVFPDRTEPDEYERTVPNIFPDLAPGSFTFVDELDGWVWTTFRDFQWDLNYRNPRVFQAVVGTMITLANRGVDVLRLDAAPFLWKEKGTTGQNRPETHELLRALRGVLSIVAPGVLLKAEAMVEPDQLAAYLGRRPDGVTAECDLAYDNQLMVMLWSMLASGSGALARHALSRRPQAPDTTSWITYLRGHDDIGWAVSDDDARAVGLDGTALRRTLSATYAGGATWQSLGVAFQPGAGGADPICGTTAALTGLTAARGGDAAAVDLAAARIEALYSVVYSFGGLPVLYMGDEIGLGNDDAWAQDPTHAGDNRWLHRPAMDWAAVAGAEGDPDSVDGRLLTRFRALARARAALSPLRAGSAARVLDVADDGVFAYSRGEAGGPTVHCLVDVAGAGARVTLPDGGYEVAHAGAGVVLDGNAVTLPPYGYAWLTR